MAFRTDDLSVLAYANGFTLWHYDVKDDDFEAKYFDPAHAMLRVNDIIFASFPNVNLLMVTEADERVRVKMCR